jgi:hypothetical protein
LLQAASRDDCSPQTLYDLRDAVEESEQDWIQALPIFLKHLSFPLHPPPYPEDDDPEHELDFLASAALLPILRGLQRFERGDPTLPTAIVRAAPEIWRWFGRWTHSALLAKGQLVASFRKHVFERTLRCMNGLTRHQQLIVPEAVDVVAAHFCLAGRYKWFQVIVDAVNEKVDSELCADGLDAAPGYDLVLDHLKLVVQSSVYDSVSDLPIAPGGLLAAWLQHSEEILDHACIYLDLRHRGNREQLGPGTLANVDHLILIIKTITEKDTPKLSSLPEHVLRRILATVLRVYHSVNRLAADTASVVQFDYELRDLCEMCCDIFLAVIDGQQSMLRSCSLLCWALRNGLLQALVETPGHATGNALKTQVAVESGSSKVDPDGPNYVLDVVVLPRMWCLSVYEAVAKSIKVAPCASAGHFLARWADVHSLMIDRMAPSKSTCNYRLVCAISLESYGANLLQCVNQDSNTRRRRCAGCMHAYFCSLSCQCTSKVQRRHPRRYIERTVLMLKVQMLRGGRRIIAVIASLLSLERMVRSLRLVSPSHAHLILGPRLSSRVTSHNWGGTYVHESRRRH